MALKSTAKWADDDWFDYAQHNLKPVFDLLEEMEIPFELLTFKSTPSSALLIVEKAGAYVAGLRIKRISRKAAARFTLTSINIAATIRLLVTNDYLLR
jgi:hypothetical protein